MGQQLTPDQIAQLINFDKNQKVNLLPKAASAFTKQEQVQILNAMVDGLTVTEDGRFSLTYNGNTFFVRCLDSRSNGFPCGSYRKDWALERLSS